MPRLMGRLATEEQTRTVAEGYSEVVYLVCLIRLGQPRGQEPFVGTTRRVLPQIVPDPVAPHK